MAISVDDSTVARWTGTPSGVATITSSTFTPPDGSLLVVCANSDEFDDSANKALAVAGGSLTWTERIRRGATEAGAGIAAIWTAPVTTGASMAVTVNRTTAGAEGTGRISAKLYIVTGQHASPIGNSNPANFTTDPQSLAITASGAGRLFGCGVDWSANGQPTSTDTADAAHYATQISVISAYKSADHTSGSQSIEFNPLGTPTGNLVVLEILAAAGGGTVNTQTLTDNVVVTDQPLDYVFFNRLLESPVVVTDGTLAEIIGNLILTKILSSTIDVADSSALFMLRTRQLTDSIDVTEPGTDTFTTTNLVLTDEVGVVDEALVRRFFNRLLGDAIDVTDDFTASTIGYAIITKVLTSAVETFDQAQWWLNRYRLGESTVLTADEVRRVVLYTRDLLDALAVSDQSLTALQRFILLTDVLSVDDSFSAVYVPPVGPATDNPRIRIGFDQPRIVVGGYAI